MSEADLLPRPATVPPDHMIELCIPPRGAPPCRYIAVSVAGGICLRMTGFRELIDRVEADDVPRPIGINCPGWPPEARVQ